MSDRFGEGALAEGTPGVGIWIGGATASGKSAVAMEVAQRLHGEIITVDSMQVFRGMDIGTAKPSAADRARVPHHLLDETEIRQPFDVATYVSRAGGAIAGILKRHRQPVLCGGTGLYFKALLHGVGSGPQPDARLRASLKAAPLSDLLAELQTQDPDTFARLDRRNPRRVIRAVEVLRLTGKSALKHRAAWTRALLPAPNFFVLSRAPEDLRERIEIRVERMFDQGLVTETQQLLAEGLASNPVALQAIGYRQVVDYLQGLRGLEETKVLIKRRTWQLARRQRNWFERHLPAQPLDVSRDEPPAETAARLIDRLPVSLKRLSPTVIQTA